MRYHEVNSILDVSSFVNYELCNSVLFLLLALHQTRLVYLQMLHYIFFVFERQKLFLIISKKKVVTEKGKEGKVNLNSVNLK